MKKVFAFLLSVLMAVGLLPVMVSAKAPSDVTIKAISIRNEDPFYMTLHYSDASSERVYVGVNRFELAFNDGPGGYYVTQIYQEQIKTDLKDGSFTPLINSEGEIYLYVMRMSACWDGIGTTASAKKYKNYYVEINGVKSNVLPRCEWLRALCQQPGFPHIGSFVSDFKELEQVQFDGTYNSDNIDFIIDLAFAESRGYSAFDYTEVTDAANLKDRDWLWTYAYKISPEEMKYMISKYFVTDTLDFGLSKYYDAAGWTYYHRLGGSGPGMMHFAQRDGMWVMYDCLDNLMLERFENFAYYVFNHDGKITGINCASDPEKTHEFSDWTVKTPAENGRDGVKTRTCTVCGYQHEAPITDNDFPYGPASRSLRDKKTNSSLAFEDGAIAEGVALGVRRTEEKEKLVSLLPSTFTATAAYEISLTLEGKDVQPAKAVTVSVPLPAGFSAATTQVFRLGSDGKPVSMDSAVSDGLIRFETGFVGTFVMVDTATEIFFELGKVDADDRITSADARLVLRASVGLENYQPFTREFSASDIDNDGRITSSDARMILRASVGLEKLS